MTHCFETRYQTLDDVLEQHLCIFYLWSYCNFTPPLTLGLNEGGGNNSPLKQRLCICTLLCMLALLAVKLDHRWDYLFLYIFLPNCCSYVSWPKNWKRTDKKTNHQLLKYAKTKLKNYRIEIKGLKIIFFGRVTL